MQSSLGRRGHRVQAIWVVLSPERAGYVEFGGCTTEAPVTPDRYDAAIIYYAGHFAGRRSGEQLEAGVCDDASDWRGAHESLEQHFGQGKEFQIARDVSVHDAEQLVLTNLHRITRVATALLEHHPIDEAEAIRDLMNDNIAG